jgi:Calcium-binding EGF domain
LIDYSATCIHRVIQRLAVRICLPDSVNNWQLQKFYVNFSINLFFFTGCGPCPSGFRGPYSEGIHITTGLDRAVQYQRCDDIDECQEGIANCGPNSRCVNTEGAFDCTCSTGFRKNEYSLSDDPAATPCDKVPGMCPDGTICDRNAICRNSGGERYG